MIHKKKWKFKIPLEVFNTEIICLGLGDKKWLSAELRRLGYAEDVIEDWAGDAETRLSKSAACHFDSDVPWFVVLHFAFIPDRRNGEHLGAVSHELLHAVCRVLERKGVKFTHDSEEVWTYALEYLTRSFWASCKKCL